MGRKELVKKLEQKAKSWEKGQVIAEEKPGRSSRQNRGGRRDGQTN